MPKRKSSNASGSSSVVSRRLWSALLLASVAILALTSTGCSSKPPVLPTVTKTQVPQLPPSLVAECQEYLEPETGQVVDVLATYISNLERAGRCRQRHNDLVALLAALEKEGAK